MLSGGCRELVSCSSRACSSASAGPLHSWITSKDRHLQVEELALACHLDHPVYDCLYLALAT